MGRRDARLGGHEHRARSLQTRSAGSSGHTSPECAPATSTARSNPAGGSQHRDPLHHRLTGAVRSVSSGQTALDRCLTRQVKRWRFLPPAGRRDGDGQLSVQLPASAVDLPRTRHGPRCRSSVEDARRIVGVGTVRCSCSQHRSRAVAFGSGTIAARSSALLVPLPSTPATARVGAGRGDGARALRRRPSTPGTRRAAKSEPQRARIDLLARRKAALRARRGSH